MGTESDKFLGLEYRQIPTLLQGKWRGGAIHCAFLLLFIFGVLWTTNNLLAISTASSTLGFTLFYNYVFFPSLLTFVGALLTVFWYMSMQHHNKRFMDQSV